jgi:hypothetical protein
VDNDTHNKKRFSIAWIISILFHLCLLLLLLWILVDMSPLMPEFVDMAFLKNVPFKGKSIKETPSQAQIGQAQQTPEQEKAVAQITPTKQMTEQQKAGAQISPALQAQAQLKAGGQVSPTQPKTGSQIKETLSQAQITQTQQKAGSQIQEKHNVDLPEQHASGNDKERIPLETKQRAPETVKESIPLATKGKLKATEVPVKGSVTRLDPLKFVGKDTLGGSSRASNITEIQQAGSQKIESGEKTAIAPPGEEVSGKVQLGNPFEISWESGTREILASPLPKFPESVKKSVVLKFRIQVMPDGTVRNIVPLQKGEATLETLTKQVLKQWLFNSLEKSAPQQSQYGVVTFRFVLK